MTVAGLQDAAVEALRDLSRGIGNVHDPVEPIRVAKLVERRYRGISPFSISDLYDALHAAEAQGQAREVKVGEVSHGFAFIEPEET